ncbi:tail fiber protein, partial [Enterobacter cloacae complex sp. P16RS2]
AATPKAVKAANDNANGRVPSGRKVNGRALAEDINITSQDIFNGQAVLIGNAADLNSFTTPGLYYQSSNSQAQAGANYPETVAGSLEVYKHAGVTQIYRIYADSRSYIRIYYNGTWTPWAKQYDTANKPAPSDIGAVAVNGGNYNATFGLGRVETIPTESNMSALYNVQAGEGGVVSGVEFNWYGHKFTVGITRDDSSGTNGLVFQHNGYTRLKIDKDGNLISSGAFQAGDKVVAGAGVFDTPNVRVYSSNNPPKQYALRDCITYVGLEADNSSAPYMRQESTGNLIRLATTNWAIGSFATPSWTIANFGMVNGIRRGGQQLQNPTDVFFGNWESPAGCTVTGITMEGRSDGRKLGVYYRQMQYFNKQANSWINVGD